MTFDFNCKDFYSIYQPIIMIFPQYVKYVLFYVQPKSGKDSSITSNEIANYISVALAVALSVYMCFNVITSTIEDTSCIIL